MCKKFEVIITYLFKSLVAMYMNLIPRVNFIFKYIFSHTINLQKNNPKIY